MMQNESPDPQAKTGRPWLAVDARGRFLLIPLWIAVGIGLYLLPDEQPPRWAYWSAVTIAGGAALAAVRWRDYRRAVLWLGLIGLGFAAAGYKAERLRQPLITEKYEAEWVQGTVVAVERQEDGSRIVLDGVDIWQWNPADTPHRLRLTLKTDAERLTPGQIIRVKAALYPLPLPALPGGYDFGRDLYFRGIGGTGFAYYTPRVIEERQSWRARLENLRTQVDRTAHQYLKGDRAAIAAALIMGDQYAISEPTMQAMRESGLSHVLSISGVHVGLVAGFVFWWARLLLVMISEQIALRWPVKQIAAVAAGLVTTVYLLLSGLQIPAIRAYVMVLLVLAGVLLGRKAFSIRNLGWAAVMILLLYPESLLQPGFQMSFAATLAIVALYEYRPLWLTAGYEAGWWERARRSFSAVLLISLVAGAVTVPYTVYHFNQASHYGVLANLVTSPMVTFLIMPMVVLSLLLMPLGLAAAPLWVMGWGIEAMIWVAHGVAELPGSVSRFASPSAWLVAGWSAVCLLAVAMKKRPRQVLCGVMLILTPFLFLSAPPWMLADGKRVVIRQGDEAVCLGLCRKSFLMEMWRRRMAVRDWEKPAQTSIVSCEGQICTAGQEATPVLIRLAKDRSEKPASGYAVIFDLTKAPWPDVLDRQAFLKSGPRAWYVSHPRLREEWTAGPVSRPRPWRPVVGAESE